MLVGSHLDRPVRLEVRDGREVVVKTYQRGGSGHVYDDMLALWLSPFGRERRPPGLPQPLSYDPATGEVVMARVPGRPLGQRGDLGDSVLRLREVAALLADLHASGAMVRRVRSADRVLASSWRKVADLHAASVGPRADIGAVAVAAAATKVAELLGGCCPADENLVPGHGDFSPRNVLGDATGLVLIDMDRMQMADPAHDLAYWGAWTWATEAMNNRVPSWEGLSHLMNSYAGHLGERYPAASGTLAFHQAAAILRIVHGWSALQNLPSVQCVLLDEAARLLDPCRT
jgi:aminoglycoside phosphotransferase (APT) family kinase protein